MPRGAMSNRTAPIFVAGFLSGGLALLVSAVASTWFGFWHVDADADPPQWEVAIARHAFASSVSRRAPRAQNPIAPTEKNLLEGLKFYREGCTGCHGDKGKP